METLSLDVGDLVQIRTTSLDLAKLVKLQPQSVNFLDISDPRAVLERVFRNFATLTKGDVFNFSYNDEIFSVAVLDVKPESDKMGVCMIETDVSVDFAAPVGYVEPERRPAGAAAAATSGVPAGGVVHSQGTMAVAINYSSLAPGAAGGETSSNFSGQGQKLVQKKKKTASQQSTPRPDAIPDSKTPVTATSARRTNGPMPLRLGPNKLFFGFDIKPVKEQVLDGEQDDSAKETKEPQFAGQGQTLRDAGKKSKVDSELGGSNSKNSSSSSSSKGVSGRTDGVTDGSSSSKRG